MMYAVDPLSLVSSRQDVSQIRRVPVPTTQSIGLNVLFTAEEKTPFSRAVSVILEPSQCLSFAFFHSSQPVFIPHGVSVIC